MTWTAFKEAIRWRRNRSIEA